MELRRESHGIRILGGFNQLHILSGPIGLIGFCEFLERIQRISEEALDVAAEGLKAPAGLTAMQFRISVKQDQACLRNRQKQISLELEISIRRTVERLQPNPYSSPSLNPNCRGRRRARRVSSCRRNGQRLRRS